ncbi:MAG: hypothetical protein AMXMBFR4_28400 [Candidatus Hydrogenedentota bacterium]
MNEGKETESESGKNFNPAYRNTRKRIVLASAILLFCLACPPPKDSLDVRDIDDSAVPQWAKDRILYAPNSIIGKYRTSSGGQLKPHPDYPSGNVVVIRVATSDWPINTAATKTYIDGIFKDDGPPHRSIAGYYKENSYGQFTLTSVKVPNWVQLNGNLSSYGDIEGNPYFIKEVLKRAGVNWLALDGNVDFSISRQEAQIVVLIPNGTPQAGYASMRYLNCGSVSVDLPMIGPVAFKLGMRPIVFFSLWAQGQPDAATNPIRSHSSVIHELNHAFFELPDRYYANSGTGQYDIMVLDQNWMHLTMYDKLKIGWVEPTFLNKHLSKKVAFPNAESTNAALVLVKPFGTAQDERFEYWVVENRNRSWSTGDYDDNFPEDGLAVWYVSEGTSANPGYDDVRLVNASTPSIDPDLYANPGLGALFRNFNAQSLLIDANGQWTGLWFRDVSAPGQFMTAEF